MKLSRKIKLNIAAILLFIAIMLLATETVDETDITTLLWTKVVGIGILVIVAYICHKDVEENGTE